MSYKIFYRDYRPDWNYVGLQFDNWSKAEKELAKLRLQFPTYMFKIRTA